MDIVSNQFAIVGSSGALDRDYLESLIKEIEAAQLLGMSVRTLQNWRVRGEGPPFIKNSRRAVRYRRKDLITWIESRQCSSTSEVQ